MTEKLYYSDGECRAFTARVVSCEAENGAYCVVLDRTAVFPGGGGQEPDSGSLNGLPIIALREAVFYARKPRGSRGSLRQRLNAPDGWSPNQGKPPWA